MGPDEVEQEFSDQNENWNQDPNTGAFVSPDGGSVEFPDQPAYPSAHAQEMVDEVLNPLLNDNANEDWNQDPNTGAYVSPDGSSIEFPDQPINPNPTAQDEVNEFLDPLLKGMEEPSEPSPWDREIPEPPPGMFD